MQIGESYVILYSITYYVELNMITSQQTSKVIYFPGGNRMRRQAHFLIAGGSPIAPELVWDTKIIFIEDTNDPAKRDPGWDTILSGDTNSSEIPNYLINKVLVQELAGCRLDYITAFFVSVPDYQGTRKAFEWKFAVDYDNPIGDDPFRTSIEIYENSFDRIKAFFGIRAIGSKTKGLTTRPAQAGTYPVLVDLDKPELLGEGKSSLLHVIGFGNRNL